MSERTVPFLETAVERYRSFAQHVLGFRHFAEYRDGMKPVQRRSIWAAYNLGATSKSKMVKSAKVVGDTFGNLHPHNQEAIYKAMANMSQASTFAPAFLGVGNWGSSTATPAAARYTSCYLSPYAQTMIDPDELACVPMDPTYDGTKVEPRFFPAKLPHLLLAGCSSLAPGYNGNIPPCPANWVLYAVNSVVNRKTPRLPTAMAYRWGGQMLSLEPSWLVNGSASAEFVPEFHAEGNQLIFTSLAPRLGPDQLEARLSKYKHFAGMTKESARDGQLTRFVARVSRGGSVEELQTFVKSSNEHYSFLQIMQYADASGEVRYRPVIEGPVRFLARWVAWRRSIVVAAANHRIDNLKKEIRRLQLLTLAVDLRKELMKILDVSKDRDEIRKRTMHLLRCSHDEASVIMAIAWTRLAKIEKSELLAKVDECKSQIIAEEQIVLTPDTRLLQDANNAANALKATLVEAATMRTNDKTLKRRGK